MVLPPGGTSNLSDRTIIVPEGREVQFGGDSATYNPTQESCSAVACHPGSGPKVYSWGSVAKGLPELKEIGEGTP